MRTPLILGILAGFTYFAFFLVFYLLDKNPLLNLHLGYTFWIPILVIYQAIKKRRDEQNNGFISFGPAFGQGILTTLVYATISAILIYLFLVLVDIQILHDYITKSIIEYETKGAQVRGFLGEETFDKVIEELEKTTPGSYAMGDFTGKMIGGFILSLIIALILKKTPSPFEEEDKAADE